MTSGLRGISLLSSENILPAQCYRTTSKVCRAKLLTGKTTAKQMCRSILQESTLYTLRIKWPLVGWVGT